MTAMNDSMENKQLAAIVLKKDPGNLKVLTEI